MSARIFQINLSQGGVPKLAVVSAEVTFQGIQGDKQSNLKVHGGPERALCVYSLERILALQQEGHSIFPGAAGENITIVDLDWSLVHPGSKITLGPQVVLEVTRFTTPCNSLTAFFKDGNFQRMNEERHTGWARVYARVLEGGKITVGDRVELKS